MAMWTRRTEDSLRHLLVETELQRAKSKRIILCNRLMEVIIKVICFLNLHEIYMNLQTLLVCLFLASAGWTSGGDHHQMYQETAECWSSFENT